MDGSRREVREGSTNGDFYLLLLNDLTTIRSSGDNFVQRDEVQRKAYAIFRLGSQESNDILWAFGDTIPINRPPDPLVDSLWDSWKLSARFLLIFPSRMLNDPVVKLAN